MNGLGIPSPGAGSTRTDLGVRHRVSGRWNPNTIKELCENRAILGVQDYGRRSEGAHRRFGPDGPRLLTADDRGAGERPKVVRTDPSVQIAAATGTAPFGDPSHWAQMREITEARGTGQRGIPRAQDPSRYPLSTRLIDLTDGCGSILYGVTNRGRALYKCSRYMRTSGSECARNSVDGEAMLRFTLKPVAELVDRRGDWDRLR